MQEREYTILDKEKRISDLRKKNQELEKFKFVLDYKMIEFRKQVEPREHDIVKLSIQINVNSFFEFMSIQTYLEYERRN